jgi:hypothetical protein
MIRVNLFPCCQGTSKQVSQGQAGQNPIVDTAKRCPCTALLHSIQPATLPVVEPRCFWALSCRFHWLESNVCPKFKVYAVAEHLTVAFCWSVHSTQSWALSSSARLSFNTNQHLSCISRPWSHAYQQLASSEEKEAAGLPCCIGLSSFSGGELVFHLDLRSDI